MLGRPGLAPVAQRQLAAWRALAGSWATELDSSGHPWTWRCSDCGKGILLATDTQGARYEWSAQTRLDMITLHLRNHHADLDPCGDVI